MCGFQRSAKLVFFSILLQMCSAAVLDCTPTGSNPMLYIISDHYVPSGAECDYWWNTENTNLATNNNQTAQVMRHSSSSLETSECLPDVSWTQQCSQLTVLMDFSANCSTTCSSKSSLHGDSPTTRPTDEEGQSETMIGVIIGIAGLFGLFGLFGLVIGLYLLYKHRDGIQRILRCSLIGRVYRTVERENNEPGPFNV